MMVKRTRSAFSLLHPLSKRRSREFQQEQQVIDVKQYAEGKRILYWDEHHKAWKKGVVSEVEGSKVIGIQTGDRKTRKHLDHVVKDHSLNAAESSRPKTRGFYILYLYIYI